MKTAEEWYELALGDGQSWPSSIRNIQADALRHAATLVIGNATAHGLATIRVLERVADQLDGHTAQHYRIKLTGAATMMNDMKLEPDRGGRVQRLVGRLLELGYYPVSIECAKGAAQLVGGKWYMPRWGAETLQHVLDVFGNDTVSPNDKAEPCRTK